MLGTGGAVDLRALHPLKASRAAPKPDDLGATRSDLGASLGAGGGVVTSEREAEAEAETAEDPWILEAQGRRSVSVEEFHGVRGAP